MGDSREIDYHSFILKHIHYDYTRTTTEVY